MNVAAILADKGRGVTTISRSSSMLDVARCLSTNKIGAIVVSDDSVGVDGIVSERDVVNAIARQGSGILDQPVAQFMTANVITCSEGDAIHILMEKMTQGRFRHLPVVNNGALVGIVSIGDVVKMRIRETQQEADAMREYISAG